MKTLKASLVLAASAAVLAVATPASAGQLITNGGFETGDYTGWNANVEPGSNGNVQVVPNPVGGSTSPISGYATPYNPAGGNFYSITDQRGPGSYSLTQSFTLSQTSSVAVSWQMFLNNQSGVVYANGRDFNTSPNQNASVDILTGSANAFTNNPGDIVANLFNPANSPTSPQNAWSNYSDTLTLGPGTYQIRFAETDNQLFFQEGVDNVSVMATSLGAPGPVPGAGVAGLAALALASLYARTRRA